MTISLRKLFRTKFPARKDSPKIVFIFISASTCQVEYTCSAHTRACPYICNIYAFMKVVLGAHLTKCFRFHPMKLFCQKNAILTFAFNKQTIKKWLFYDTLHWYTQFNAIEIAYIHIRVCSASHYELCFGIVVLIFLLIRLKEAKKKKIRRGAQVNEIPAF